MVDLSLGRKWTLSLIKISPALMPEMMLSTGTNNMSQNDKTWSPQQEAIFEWFTSGTGNLVVRARAGTGKTTTILEGIGHAPEAKILLCAFNKRIADELVKKLRNPRAEAKTLHGVGFGCIKQYWNRVNVDNDRGERLVREAMGPMSDSAPFEAVRLAANLASKGKEIEPLTATEESLVDLAIQFDLIPDDNIIAQWPLQAIAKVALAAMKLSATTNDGTIDFSDMLFLPLVNGWAHGKYDLVVVDECQDMNQAQILLAQRVCRKSGRIVVVGDDRQAIYGFRGADSGSLDRLKKELEASELGLTITYRCPKSIVQEAQEYVPDYEAAPTAPEGIVSNMNREKMLQAALPGDFILSRKNAPLAGVCLALMREGRKAKIEGRDIGKGLTSLVRKLKGKSLSDLFKKLETWRGKEIDRAQSLSKKSATETRMAYVNDQAETIVALSEGVSSVGELEKRIENLFIDNNVGNSIVCSTVHKSKGLESDRVFVLDNTFTMSGPEEDNIMYVCVTRAKKELVYVHESE